MSVIHNGGWRLPVGEQLASRLVVVAAQEHLDQAVLEVLQGLVLMGEERRRHHLVSIVAGPIVAPHGRLPLAQGPRLFKAQVEGLLLDVLQLDRVGDFVSGELAADEVCKCASVKERLHDLLQCLYFCRSWESVQK